MLGKTTSLRIRTPEGVDFEIPIASPFSRCLALAIDLAIVVASTLLLGQVFAILQMMVSQVPVIGRILTDFGTGALIVLQFVVSVFYGMIMEWLWSGRTVGKKILRLRVIDERGLALGFRQVALRNIFRVLDSLPSSFYLLGGISCFLTKRCQRIGDIAAGTLVVREEESRTPKVDEWIRFEQNSFSALPHLEARLRQRTSPEEARLVLDAIARRNELDPAARLELFAKLAEFFRERADFPEEITMGLSDEQYVRNVAASLVHRAAV